MEGSPACILVKKLEEVKKALHKRNKLHFDFFKDQFQLLTSELAGVQLLD